MLKRNLAALLALTVLTGACANGKTAEAEAETSQDEIPMQVSIMLKGDLEITINERIVPVRLVRMWGGAIDEVLGVSPVEAVPEGPVAAMPGVMLRPYKGEGRYEVPPGSPYDLGPDGQPKSQTKDNKSSMRLEWWPPGGDTEEYVVRAKPCSVQIDREDGMKGRLSCPEIVGEANGLRFSVEFRWEKV